MVLETIKHTGIPIFLNIDSALAAEEQYINKLIEMSLENVLQITNEERSAIENSYGRSNKEIEEDKKIIKEWLKKQQHLPQNEDDKRLRSMLILNKFSLEKTKKKLDMYYSIRNVASEFYTNREPSHPQIQRLMNEDLTLFPLPNLTPDLHRVYLVKFKGDGSKFNINTCVKVMFGTFDLRMVYDASLGDHFIMDLGSATLSHIIQITPVIVKKSYDLLQKAYSDKIKGVHFINMPPFGSTLVTIMNAVLSEKLNNRVHVYKDLKSLQDVLSAKVLPNEYGGTAGPCEQLYDEWKKFYASKNNWLKELAEKKSDEKKRIGEPLDSGLFGISGSFRQLNLD